jgi:AcrR family transcriptional regulator
MGDLDPRVERTRCNVLAAAVAVLREEGWDALTQARVAERAGVGRATVYRHWPSVGDLLFDALSETELKDHTVPTGDLRRDLIEELLAFGRSMTKSQTGRIMTALIDRAEWDDDIASVRQRLAANGTSVLKRILRSARERGDMPPAGDDELLVAQLLGPLTFRRFFTGHELCDQFVTDVVDQALRAGRAEVAG